MCDKTEYIDHLEGMLNRDIRTAKTPVYSFIEEVPPKFGISEKMESSFTTESTEIDSQHSCHPSRTKSTLNYKWKKGYYLYNYWKNLQKVLILVVYLTLISCPTVQSAPSYNRMDSSKLSNPCGWGEDTDSGSIPSSNVSDTEILDAVISSIASALNKANEFKDNFSQRTLFRPFDRALVEMIPDITKYEWLVKLPNEFVDKSTAIPSETLENLKIEETLSDAYLKLQLVAVALDHTVQTQKKNNGKFKKEFENAFSYLSNVLCELRSAMRTPPPSITSDIIPQEFRELNKTESGPFDFFVLRECIKTLNYFTKMFEHLKKNSQKV